MRNNTPFTHRPTTSTASEYGVPGRRQRSLIRPERRRMTSRTRTRELGIREHEFTGDDIGDDGTSKSCWGVCWGPTTRLLTLCCPGFCLKTCGRMREERVQAAWREKVALCSIIVVLCLALGFLTFGLSTIVCRPPGGDIYKYEDILDKNTKEQRWVIIHGEVYDVSPAIKPYPHKSRHDYYSMFAGMDITPFFQYAPSCMALGVAFKCKMPGSNAIKCHPPEIVNDMSHLAQVAFDWKDIQGSTRYVYNGRVYDLAQYLDQVQEEAAVKPFGEKVDAVLRSIAGKDGTMALARLDPQIRACMHEMFLSGNLQVKTFGCILTDIILFVSLVAILGLVFAKFFLAVGFAFVMGHRLGKKNRKEKKQDALDQQQRIESTAPLATAPFSAAATNLGNNSAGGPMYTILLVTCYSEGEAGLRTTLDSLTESEFPDERKLLFVISDGIVQGSGNDRSTPDILIDMMELATDSFEPYHFDPDGHPTAKSYVALADGTKRNNMARVYAGWYRSGGHRIPMILVVKCGIPSERAAAKPGNRGKRDSQIILMSFLSKLLFDDRMTPLEYELFFKIQRLTGVTPDAYELVLMVDADTRVAPDALDKMARVMAYDAMIMGLCGETQIENKTESWVTAIQVFEYYISHHSSKAFESIFGGVTCLPGCFCMYRIKAPKQVVGVDYWVPLLASPDIVDSYSENITTTLHKKNLLLLGEDRYLTTLMLKTFPRRKLIFVPSATCQTIVPSTFRVLLSQRRRWINSTVHNLFELVLVPDLCGAFCCSMQFVIFMELVGTLVLPAAIMFTGVLIINTFLSDPQWIPLGLLAAILGLPAILILFTTRNLSYVLWFLVYIVALPIWNFVLPVYAYWHMDDFSWGETRKLEGVAAVKDDSHERSEGKFDYTAVSMRRWHEYDRERQQKNERWTSGVSAIAAQGIDVSVARRANNTGAQITSPLSREKSSENLLYNQNRDSDDHHLP